jgi:hypothetical protein
MKLLVTATVFVALLFSATTSAGGLECEGRAFPWGGECRSASDGAEFQQWLNRHGTSAQAFKARHPELAAIFPKPWPQKPLWKTCVTGYKCARAVIGHYFGGDIGYELSIVDCETGGTFWNRALGKAGERGWWQIHPIHFGGLDEDRLWDVRYNTSVAYRMSHGGRNFDPWTCAHHGKTRSVDLRDRTLRPRDVR